MMDVYTGMQQNKVWFRMKVDLVRVYSLGLAFVLVLSVRMFVKIYSCCCIVLKSNPFILKATPKYSNSVRICN